MGRPSDEEKQRRARETLIETIAKILDLEPILGGKWRIGMVDYYIDRLAELVVYQAGFQSPSKQAIQAIDRCIRELLEIE